MPAHRNKNLARMEKQSAERRCDTNLRSYAASGWNGLAWGMGLSWGRGCGWFSWVCFEVRVRWETGWQRDANVDWTPHQSCTDMCLYLTYVLLFLFTPSGSGELTRNRDQATNNWQLATGNRRTRHLPSVSTDLALAGQTARPHAGAGYDCLCHNALKLLCLIENAKFPLILHGYLHHFL